MSPYANLPLNTFEMPFRIIHYRPTRIRDRYAILTHIHTVYCYPCQYAIKRPDNKVHSRISMVPVFKLQKINIQKFCVEQFHTLSYRPALPWQMNNSKVNKSKNVHFRCVLGAVSIRKTVFPGMAIPMLKIRRPSGRLIFNMEIAIRR